MTRVCFTVDPPFLGGAEHYVSRIALGLNRAEFEPTVLVCPAAADDRRLADWVDGVERAGVRVFRTTARLPFRPHTALRILRGFDQLAPDIVHINVPGPYDGQMGLLAPLARMSGARAVVTTEHLPMVGYLWKRALVKTAAYSFVDRILTVSRANVTFLEGRQSLPGHKIEVIPNAVVATFGQLQESRSSLRNRYHLPLTVPVVIFVGNLLPHKGLMRLAAALKQIESPWHLAVVGEGEDRGRCEALLSGSGMRERVTFFGARPAGEVEQIMAAADVHALPSSVEGMPYVVLEAMACGLPVIAGDVFGVPEMVEDGVTGFLIDPDDVPALTERLRALLGSSELRVRMGDAGRKRFEERFVLDDQIKAVERVYRKLTGGKGTDRGR